MGYCSDCHKFMSVILMFFRLRYSESADEMKLEKNDKEGGVRRGKTESAHCPMWTFSSFQGERVGWTFLVFGPVSCGLGHRYTHGHQRPTLL